MNNQEIEEVARRLWAKHPDALEKLMEFRPDFLGEICSDLAETQTNWASTISSTVAFTISPAKSGPRNFRFVVKDWEKIRELKLGNNTWIDNSHLIAIEVIGSSNGEIRLKMVLGPGDQEVREKIHSQLKTDLDVNTFKIWGVTKSLYPKWTTLYSKVLLTSKKYQELVEKGASSDQVAREIRTKSAEEFAIFLPRLQHIFESIFEGSEDVNS